MRISKILILAFFGITLFSCRKQPLSTPAQPDPSIGSVRRVLLRDIIIPNLPSPFYHFEYNADSSVTNVGFSSGFTNYDIVYDGNRILEMRNNTAFNHDVLHFFYEDDRKIAAIDFKNEANVIYRHAYFTFQETHIKEIWWSRKDGAGNFPIDRIITFTYYPDGNLKIINDARPSHDGLPQHIYITKFEQYDSGINVDDFSLIHDGIHDHLFLLQAFRLQKNNPKKEIFSVDGLDLYHVDYSYTYNSDNCPNLKTGDLLYVGGPTAGERFLTNASYSYY